MNYGNDLYKTLKDEKNLINRMYLYEIILQYRKVEAAMKKVDSNGDDSYEQLAHALTSLISQLESSKYHFNKSNKTGFKKSCPIFWPTYLEDLLNAIVKRQKVLSNKGITWGKHPFSMNIGFKPKSFQEMEKDLCYKHQDSPGFLQISQQIDVHLRATGKKFFSKNIITLPLVIFSIHKRFGIDQLIRDRYYSLKAKETFDLSKFFVVCETFDSSIPYEEINPEIDLLFVLKRKKSTNRRGGYIDAEVLKSLSTTLESTLYESLASYPVMEDNGCIAPV